MVLFTNWIVFHISAKCLARFLHLILCQACTQKCCVRKVVFFTFNVDIKLCSTYSKSFNFIKLSYEGTVPVII